MVRGAWLQQERDVWVREADPRPRWGAVNGAHPQGRSAAQCEGGLSAAKVGSQVTVAAQCYGPKPSVYYYYLLCVKHDGTSSCDPIPSVASEISRVD
jgi:hypothetical protein